MENYISEEERKLIDKVFNNTVRVYHEFENTSGLAAYIGAFAHNVCLLKVDKDLIKLAHLERWYITTDKSLKEMLGEMVFVESFDGTKIVTARLNDVIAKLERDTRILKGLAKGE